MAALSCKQCGVPFRAEDLLLDVGLAQCASCGSSWDLAARRPREREELPRPPGWAVERAPWRLSYRWFGVEGAFMVVFAVVWNAFMAMFVLGAVSSGDPTMVALTLVMPHTWVGAGLAWYALATVLNRTTLEVEHAELRVRHGPVWWPGALTMAVADVEQLYVEKSSVRVNKRARWNLAVLDRQGVARVAVRLLRSAEEARWLEQQIEAALRIEDRAVPGQA